ncbi:MAG: DUF4834 family protein [Paludibacter sp.]|nr:DUF4834 family protein [Paludibacter sp.]
MGFLMSIVFIVLVIGLVVVLSVFGLIRSVFITLFGFGRQKRAYQSQAAGNQTYSNRSNKKKVFGDNEGEYVDYEEIR